MAASSHIRGQHSAGKTKLLTPKQVAKIIELRTMKNSDLALRFGVGPQLIQRVKMREITAYENR